MSLEIYQISTMKGPDQLIKSTRIFLSGSIGISVVLILLAALYGSMKIGGGSGVVPAPQKPRRETFMDCSMSASCALTPP